MELNKSFVTEIVPKKLYFATVSTFRPRNDDQFHYISTDDTINHPKIKSYFGPPSICDVYHYFIMLREIIKNSKPSQKIIHCSSFRNQEKCTNAIFLVGSFVLLAYGFSPNNVMRLLRNIKNFTLLDYCDTTDMQGTPKMKMKYFYFAIIKAIELNWFSIITFDEDEYDHLGNINEGDLNWILPGKLIAFSGPRSRSHLEIILNFCKEINMKAIVRLNHPIYEKKIFIKQGIAHYDLYFPDCTCPSKEIIEQFFHIVDCTPGVVGVHCKAGMGRTGTLIAAYLIKNFPIRALEAVAWTRICRPGSVIGLQQKFLLHNENWMKRLPQNCNVTLVSPSNVLTT